MHVNHASAIKEAQWQAREERARQHYERQLEEKRKKLEEQRVKEDRRRAAVEEKRRQKLEEDKVQPLWPLLLFHLTETSAVPAVLASLSVGVFVTEGSARGGDAADGGQEPKSQAEAQSLVLGRFSAAQHPQHSSRYLGFSDV